MLYICSNARSGSNLVVYFLRKYCETPIEMKLIHNLENEIPDQESPIITVIRDYRGCILSFIKLMDIELNEENIIHSASEYGKQIKNFFELPNKHEILYYEDMMNKFVPTMISLVNFLNLKLDKMKILNLEYLIGPNGKDEIYRNIYVCERGFDMRKMSAISEPNVGKWKGNPIISDGTMIKKMQYTIQQEIGLRLYTSLLRNL